MIDLRGADLADGLRGWIKADLQESPRLAHDLGKFFFTVSLGTFGAITGLKKASGVLVLTLPLAGCAIVLFVSIIIALGMVLPRKLEIDPAADLQKLYLVEVERVTARSWDWFALWTIGTLLGGWALFV